MEKSGRIELTPEEQLEFEKGLVPKRIQENWGLTFSELKAIMSTQQTHSLGEHNV